MSADPRGSRDERGYGYEHQQARAALVAAAKPETACVRCGRPLGDPALAHLGHSDDRSTWVELEHARCNVTAANRMRASRARRQEEPHPGIVQPEKRAGMRTHDGDSYTSGGDQIWACQVAPTPLRDDDGHPWYSSASLPAASVGAEGNARSALRYPTAVGPRQSTSVGGDDE